MNDYDSVCGNGLILCVLCVYLWCVCVCVCVCICVCVSVCVYHTKALVSSSILEMKADSLRKKEGWSVWIMHNYGELS